MAERGVETLRHGPMKPFGLPDPRTGREPYAVVQLRQDDLARTHFNLVGFQTKLKVGEQRRIFRMLPGLENAEFVRYGMLHRNTYINGPAHLDRLFRWKKDPRVFFAGQLTGVEGYLEIGRDRPHGRARRSRSSSKGESPCRSRSRRPSARSPGTSRRSAKGTTRR